MPWAATLTFCSWLVDAFVWANRLPSWGMSYPHQNTDLPGEVLLGIGGLLFIAPMPILFAHRKWGAERGAFGDIFCSRCDRSRSLRELWRFPGFSGP